MYLESGKAGDAMPNLVKFIRLQMSPIGAAYFCLSALFIIAHLCLSLMYDFFRSDVCWLFAFHKLEV